MAKDSKIIVALDNPDLNVIRDFVNRVTPDLCRLKIGSIVFTRHGPKIIEELQSKGFELFLDLKFHDIPATVSGACRAAAELGVWMVNIHCFGGRTMMSAARNAVDKVSGKKPILLGVTILTSLNDSDLKAIACEFPAKTMVPTLAQLAQTSGLDGVVCSGQEAQVLRETLGSDFILVTPGIRLAESTHHDQQRVMTPQAALAAGSDFLVMGRAITESNDPLETLKNIQRLYKVTGSKHPE